MMSTANMVDAIHHAGSPQLARAPGHLGRQLVTWAAQVFSQEWISHPSAGVAGLRSVAVSIHLVVPAPLTGSGILYWSHLWRKPDISPPCSREPSRCCGTPAHWWGWPWVRRPRPVMSHPAQSSPRIVSVPLQNVWARSRCRPCEGWRGFRAGCHLHRGVFGLGDHMTRPTRVVRLASAIVSRQADPSI